MTPRASTTMTTMISAWNTNAARQPAGKRVLSCSFGTYGSRRCHQQYADNFKPEPDDPLHQPAQGGLVGQFGAEDGRVRARADLAFVELRTERSVRLTGENDLVYARSHSVYTSQLVVALAASVPGRPGLSRHPIPGDRNAADLPRLRIGTKLIHP
jgi:hypothetical protein